MMQVKPLIPRLGEDNKQKQKQPQQQQQQPAAKHKPNTTTTNTTKPIEKGSNAKS